MMRGPKRQSIVCRTKDGLVEKVEELKWVKDKYPILGWPFIRGCAVFLDSMVVRHYAAKGYGAGRIRNELFRRGVPKELWDDALSEMPVQDDAIDKFVRSRLTDPSDRAQIKKVTDGLVRRGYS